MDDKCPPCSLYIIARRANGLHERLSDIFPGCRIETWEPAPPRLRGKPAKAFEFIRAWFTEHYKDLSVRSVMEAIGETSRPNFNKNIRKHAGFRLALEHEGIHEVYSGSSCVGFREVPEYEPVSADVFLEAERAEREMLGAERRRLVELVLANALSGVRRRLIGLIQERARKLGTTPSTRKRDALRPLQVREVGEARVSIAVARVSDLTAADLVKLECTCGHSAQLTPEMLEMLRVPPSRRLWDLHRVQCGRCGERGRAAVMIRWADAKQ